MESLIVGIDDSIPEGLRVLTDQMIANGNFAQADALLCDYANRPEAVTEALAALTDIDILELTTRPTNKKEYTL